MIEARRWLLTGRVQGVGFRPFVFLMAQRFDLKGVVQNQLGQVMVEAEGEPATLDAFSAALMSDAPPLSHPHIANLATIPLFGFTAFEILDSASAGETHIHVPPDLYLCADCQREMETPQDRRYRYPFINCTQCGPRYTLIARMPYDRVNTTMAGFDLCEACRDEYEDPTSRRFHAEPIACPQCGPQLAFVAGDVRLQREAALDACIAALRRGEIVAVKGIGGYHLMCDARNADSIARLRARKHRPHKALAVMFKDMAAVRAELDVSAQAATALCDAARPIVLLPRSPACSLPEGIAPGLNEVGAMLPYTPLHHLLLAALDTPLLATSANLSGEPVLTEGAEVEARLCNVADAFLHHDRPIARPADDSVLRIIAGQSRLIRPGRGIAPIEIELPFEMPQPTLAVGGHMKNTIALGWCTRAVLTPHIGDMDAPRSIAVFEQVIADMQQLYGVNAETIVCDAHPHYASSRWAAKQGLPVQTVWHHHAHAAALALEHGADKTWLTFAWDGVGLGEDGTLWGGETLHGRIGDWRRAAYLRPFRLPGGNKAAREPWRSAAGLCWEAGMDRSFPVDDITLLHTVWQRGINTPYTSAAGRLFDGAAHLLGLLDHASYEGQGGMLLEQCATGEAADIVLPLHEDAKGMLVIDWQPLIAAMSRKEIPLETRAMQFHRSLAHSIVMQAQRLHTQQAFDAVGLTGGVFQNKLLAELALEGLHEAGFAAYLPQQIPCNDGGIALGQLMEAGVKNG
ncbi:MAG: carbamoyltransferase HypF [Gammaproteobacteria bacterium]|nr:carbamoyltransferase HypF [Gammaproteobacteria bacterium]MBU1625037.1 carbamoyltransferase HypF [Gammaproteobacteria bacterium]MBU1981297.1 carbamoyltransferase HypF [Gammaproteobacteria bacterium]